jgi:hypothetical protein
MKNPFKTLLLGLLFGTMVSLVFLLVEFLKVGHVVFNNALMKEAAYTYTYSVVLTFINKGFFEYLGYLKIWQKYSR